MIAHKIIGYLALALVSAADADLAPDCTHIIELQPTPAPNDIKTVWSATERVVSLVDCVGCSNLYTLRGDPAGIDGVHQATSTVLVEGTGTDIVYKCARTPGPGDMFASGAEVRRDVADVSTVSSTYTRTVWASTTIAIGIFNCTVPVYRTAAAVAGVAARDTAGEAAPVIHVRQTSAGSTPTPATATTPDSTTTVWAVTNVTPTEATTVTNYQCAATMEYIIQVVTTRTIPYNVTTYQSTATPTSTVVCPGVGGFPADYSPPEPSAMLPETATTVKATTAAAMQSEAAAANVILDADLIAVVPDGAQALTTVLTSTLNQTSTVFRAFTVEHPGVLTRVQYQCSSLPFDTTSTYPLLLTAYSTTRTAYRYMRCRQTATPVTGAAAEAPSLDATSPLRANLQRQSGPTPSSAASGAPSASHTFHRTAYVPSPTTTTLAMATTKVAYVCLGTGTGAGAGTRT